MGGSGEEKTEQIGRDWRKAARFSCGGQGLYSCVKNKNKEFCMFQTECERHENRDLSLGPYVLRA